MGDVSKEEGATPGQAFKRYLSPLSAWALAFGCAVGWGAFVMPGTTFLPVAGPLGSSIGIGIGALVMMVIAFNYHFMMQKYPSAGGAYTYVKRVCNYDHAFLCAWFLLLNYLVVTWANATALVLIPRRLIGNAFQFGWHYTVGGYEVYLGETLISIAALLLVDCIFRLGTRFAMRINTLLAVTFGVGTAVCFAAAMGHHAGGIEGFEPLFSVEMGYGPQIFAIVALAPWAFVGFEALSHGTEEFRFDKRKSIFILGGSVVVSTLVYAMMSFMSASVQPEGFLGWSKYVPYLEGVDGIQGLPTFFAIKSSLGSFGIAMLCATTLGAIFTSLIGLLFATSRLVGTMAKDGILPKKLSTLSRNGTPMNAVRALVLLSCLVPFVGRTALSWLVDVTTIGACIAYGYVSWCTFKLARRDNSRAYMVTAVVGIAISVAFIIYFLVPNFWSINAFSTESYLVLAGWSILGFIAFRFIFHRDRTNRFGKSAVLWLALLFLIFFASHMWVRQATYRLTEEVVMGVGDFYEKNYPCIVPESTRGSTFLTQSKRKIDNALTRYNFVQMSLVVIALGIMFSVYSTMSKRERDAAKAKSYFFSTVSHDIRTPLNAIIGFSQMMKTGFDSKEEHEQAVDTILVSSKTLLGLINDILDLSKLESGKMVLTREATNCSLVVGEIVESFRSANRKSGLEVRYKAEEKMPCLYTDPLRLRQIVFNLVSNAIKFTERGYVEVRTRFDRLASQKGRGLFIMDVEDTGTGISESDQARIASPYVQVGSKMARNGGTGLGLAICKQLVSAMGGKITLKSQVGKGTTFTITVPAEIAPDVPEGQVAVAAEGSEEEQPHKAATVEPAPAPETPAPYAAAAPAAPAAPVAKAAQEPPPPPPPQSPSVPAASAVLVPSSPTAPAPADGAAKPKGVRLLIADDSKMNLTVLKAMLKRLGSYDVEVAMDGMEALKRLEDESAPPFDMVLTDMWMPNMDGAGLVKAIRSNARLANLDVEVVTADVELQKSYAEKGFSNILLKPVTFESLKSALEASGRL